MPDTSPLRLHCPDCGSLDIVYTCEPTCCFNHVCNACRAVFYPSTAATGRARADLTRQPDPDSCAPTVACDRCRALAVYLVAGEPACTACGAILEIHYDG